MQQNRLTAKIAYTAMFVSVCFIVNYLYVPFGDLFSVSFVPAVCILSGIILNPWLGAVVGALSDILGCFAKGYAPNIFILLGSTLWGVIAGVFYKYLKTKDGIKIVIGILVAYVVCSFFLNAYGLYTYTSKGIPFLKYAIIRIPVQLPNTVVNAAAVILINKALKGKLQVLSDKSEVLEDKTPNDNPPNNQK